jgi:hypothetical protein
MENHHDIVEERLGEIAINLGTKVNAWAARGSAERVRSRRLRGSISTPRRFQTIV